MSNSHTLKGSHVNDNEAQDEDNEISLFEQEESELLTIHCDDSATALRLRQYNSSDPRWGIYSCVWDGGIALWYYISMKQQHHKCSNMMLLDLGSGTGIVGIGVSLLSSYSYLDVVVTDLPEAMPLLNENIQLNHPMNNAKLISISAKELIWGSRQFIDDWFDDWLIKAIDNIDNDNTDDDVTSIVSRKRLLYITGADIVYRPSFFNPLLTTLQIIADHIYCQYLYNDNIIDSSFETKNVDLEILLSCQSIRTNLNDFIQEAITRKFLVKLIAVIRLPAHISIEDPTYWNRIQYIPFDHVFTKQQEEDHNDDNKESYKLFHQQNMDKSSIATPSTPPVLPKGLGIIWILSIHIREGNHKQS